MIRSDVDRKECPLPVFACLANSFFYRFASSRIEHNRLRFQDFSVMAIPPQVRDGIWFSVPIVLSIDRTAFVTM